jgi:hypothetical protein
VRSPNWRRNGNRRRAAGDRDAPLQREHDRARRRLGSGPSAPARNPAGGSEEFEQPRRRRAMCEVRTPSARKLDFTGQLPGAVARSWSRCEWRQAASGRDATRSRDVGTGNSGDRVRTTTTGRCSASMTARGGDLGVARLRQREIRLEGVRSSSPASDRLPWFRSRVGGGRCAKSELRADGSRISRANSRSRRARSCRAANGDRRRAAGTRQGVGTWGQGIAGDRVRPTTTGRGSASMAVRGGDLGVARLRSAKSGWRE